MKTAFIFDIDGVLSDCSNRLPLILCDKPNWKEFFNRTKEDTLEIVTASICKMLGMYHEIIIITARPEWTRNMTEEWLIENNIQYDQLHMRSNDDHRPAHIIKKEVLKSLKHQVLAVFEDGDEIVKMYRDKGILCYQP